MWENYKANKAEKAAIMPRLGADMKISPKLANAPVDTVKAALVELSKRPYSAENKTAIQAGLIALEDRMGVSEFADLLNMLDELEAAQ